MINQTQFPLGPLTPNNSYKKLIPVAVIMGVAVLAGIYFAKKKADEKK